LRTSLRAPTSHALLSLAIPAVLAQGIETNGWRPGPISGALWCTLLATAWLAWAIRANRLSAAWAGLRTSNLAPAICGVLAAATIVAALAASAFLENVGDERLVRLAVALWRQAPESEGHEFAARSSRGVTLALSWMVAIVAVWVTAGIWWECRSRRYSCAISVSILLFAIATSAVLGVLGLFQFSPGLDSAYGNAMLCAGWERSNTAWMAMVSDANNVLGIFIPVVVALGMCLLLEPVGRRATLLARLRARARTQSSNAWTAIIHPSRPLRNELATAELEVIGQRSKKLDVLLYIGATSLAFGILQLSAVYSSALAAMPSVASVKLKVDICKSLSAPPESVKVKEKVGQQWGALGCSHLSEDFAQAEVVDSAREFARSTTLVFGIAFSVILAALYAPAVLNLKRAANVATEHLSADQRASDLQHLGIESDLLGKAGKVITTLTPLFASVIATILASIG